MIRHFCFSSLLYRKSLAVLLAVTISGCATSEFGRFPKAYPGPRVPEAQVAELSRKQFSRRVTDYWFTHFDGSQIIDGIRPLFSERYDVMPVRNASVLEML